MTKRLCFLLTLVIGPSWTTAAQEESPNAKTSPLAVLKESWKVENSTRKGQGVREVQTTVSPGTGTMIPRRRGNRTILVSPEPQPSTIEPATTGKDEQAGPDERYHYTATVRNLSRKAIRSVNWDYVFLESDTKSEIARLRFSTNVNINPGKSQQLDAFTLTPPTPVASVKELKKRHRAGFEEIEISLIHYADGTVWHR